MEAQQILQVMVLKVGIQIQNSITKRDGGPLFDMGPYYLTALVKALGPVQEVIG